MQQAALEIVKQEGLPHLVILDIMMPGMDGFAVANELRKIGDVSIIFLSALSDTETKVEGLTRYAEDYITKPFAFTELLARVRRVLVRTSTERAVDPELVIDEGLRINFAQQYAVVNNQQITLTPTENRLLHVLYNNRGPIAQRYSRITLGTHSPSAQQDRGRPRQSKVCHHRAQPGLLLATAQPDRHLSVIGCRFPRSISF